MPVSIGRHCPFPPFCPSVELLIECLLDLVCFSWDVLEWLSIFLRPFRFPNWLSKPRITNSTRIRKQTYKARGVVTVVYLAEKVDRCKRSLFSVHTSSLFTSKWDVGFKWIFFWMSAPYPSSSYSTYMY